MGTELMLANPSDLSRRAEQVVKLCRKIVKETAVLIQGRLYPPVSSLQAVANAFGCVASSRDVTKVYDETDERFIGYKAVGEIRRLSDGVILATGEGFVGVDEPRWFGGKAMVWDEDKRRKVEKMFDPAPDYSVRSMVQTRAIGRACKAAFAFIIVMIDKNIAPVAAEDMEPGDEPHGSERTTTPEQHAEQKKNGNGGNGGPRKHERWQDYTCTYGKKDGPLRGKKLGELTDSNLMMLHGRFLGNGAPRDGDGKLRPIDRRDADMVEGLKLWSAWFEAEDKKRGEQ